MNVVDVLLVLVIIVAAWNGIRRGFFTGAAGLLAWLGSLLLTFYLYPYTAAFLERSIPDSVWVMPLAFLGTLLLTGLILSVLADRLLASIPARQHVHPVNKVAGFLPGVAAGVVYAAILAALLLLLPISQAICTSARESWLAQQLTTQLERVETRLSPVFDETINRSINKLTIEPGSDKTVKLPFTVADPEERRELERDMLQLVNQERASEGLPPLRADEQLAGVARQHARDMFARGYFSHINPEGETPFDRIRAAKIRYLAAGENLALARTLPAAHGGLMQSPGHRANILRPAFGRVGIGILDGGVYGLMVTQVFGN